MLYSIVIALHVLAACIWVGGALFLGGIALPAARALDNRDARRTVTRTIARRFRWLGWAALVFLVASGLYMSSRWGLTWTNTTDLSVFAADGRLRARLLGYKVVTVVLLLVTSFLHDWIIGPKAGRAEPGTERRDRLQFWSALLGIATALLSICTVILASWMVRPWSFPIG